MTQRRLRLLLLTVVLCLGLPVLLLYRSDLPFEDVRAEYANAESEFETILGSRVHVRDDGVGPTLVWLHGTGSSLHTWDGWRRFFGPDFRVIRVDLQGYGLTGPNDDRDYSIDRQIAVLDALMERRGIDRWAVAGNSLGGLIAWRWAARQPERITATVLLAPAGAPRDGERVKTGFRMIDLARIPGVRDVTMRLTPRFIVRRALEQVYGDPSKLADETVRRHHRMLLRAGNRQALVDAMSQRRGSGPVPTPADVTQPTLLQWGELDTWIPVSDAARFAAVMPNAETILYPDLGHVPMEEGPERTAHDALDFLRRHGLSDRTPTSP